MFVLWLALVAADDLKIGPSRTRAEEYLRAAEQCSGSRGEGERGWLNLLAAYSLATEGTAEAEFIKDTLTENYVAAGSPHLAPVKGLPTVKRPPRVEPTPIEGRLTRVFPTVLGRWFLNASDDERRCIYDASVAAYPTQGTDTERNHQLFRTQMSSLPEAYMPSLAACPLWDKIHSFARSAAQQLTSNAYDADCILWTSVHTPASVHEPHNTQDSLVGGVYYVRVPEGSGRLGLLDPRGTWPGHAPTTDLPKPPFHHTLELEPQEDLLVLFPGWLVHEVLPASAPFEGFRVSVSVNFKGEWLDTVRPHLV